MGREGDGQKRRGGEWALPMPDAQCPIEIRICLFKQNNKPRNS